MKKHHSPAAAIPQNIFNRLLLPGFAVCGFCVFFADILSAQTGPLADSIWEGYLKGSTKEVAHYQGGVKSGSVTGATANQVPMEIWFPGESTFCVVYNNGKVRASAPDGRNGIIAYTSDLYDLIVGENPSPTAPFLTWWRGNGTVDKVKKTLKGTGKTELDGDLVMSADARYVYKKKGSVETLTVTGTASLPTQKLDSHGDGWKLNPGWITYSGTFTKTTRRVSVEGAKNGPDGF
jgi:hypothetical protein